MKYIRTKDGRIVEVKSRRIVFPVFPAGEARTIFNDNILEKDVIKESDDLKELFDGYYLDIDNHPFDRTQIYGNDELQKALEERKDWQNYSDRKGLEYEINLYAFIKTDKGFVFVAKINEKGNPELL